MLTHETNQANGRGPMTRVRRGFDVGALVAARESAGMGVPYLARQSGVTEHAIWRWENGSNQPRIDSLRDVVRALNLKSGDLLKVPEDQRMVSDLRNLALLTQPEAAHAAGMATYTYGQIERGHGKLTDARAIRIADVFGVTSEEVKKAYERARTRPSGEPA